jgi:hypothetical protein
MPDQAVLQDRQPRAQISEPQVPEDLPKDLKRNLEVVQPHPSQETSQCAQSDLRGVQEHPPATQEAVENFRAIQDAAQPGDSGQQGPELILPKQDHDNPMGHQAHSGDEATERRPLLKQDHTDHSSQQGIDLVLPKQDEGGHSGHDVAQEEEYDGIL